MVIIIVLSVLILIVLLNQFGLVFLQLPLTSMSAILLLEVVSHKLMICTTDRWEIGWHGSATANLPTMNSWMVQH